DICGPFQVESLVGMLYFVTFKDDASGYHTVRFLRNKSDVLIEFKNFVRLVQNQLGVSIKVLRSDNAKEYLSKDFVSVLNENGIVHEKAPAYTPQLNVTAERENRTLVEKARSMLHSAGLPLKVWAEAVNTAAYL